MVQHCLLWQVLVGINIVQFRFRVPGSPFFLTYPMCHHTIQFLQCVFLMSIFLGGLGGLTPGIIGVGAAGTLGGAAVVNQMMDSCPASRPCQVGSHFSHCALYYTLTRFSFLIPTLFLVFYTYQVRDPQNPLNRKCCRLLGVGGTPRCPRTC